MKKPLYLKLLFLLIPFLIAAAPSREFNYTSGNTILSEQNTANENAIFLYLQGGVDTYKDNTIVNEDINTSANIQSDKLNLTSIVQGVNITSSGSFTNAGTFAQSGALTITGNSTFAGTTIADLGIVTTVDINGGTLDGVTIGAASAPTVTDLGSVATADINGGTLDGVNIGTTTATGELIVNDSSDDADGLGAQGTSGQFLQSAGAGSNPSWATASWTWVSTDTWANVLLTPDIEIIQGVRYMAVVDFVPYTNGQAPTCDLLFGDASAYDTGSNYANPGNALSADSYIVISPAIDNSDTTGMAHAIFYLSPIYTDQMLITGQVTYTNNSAQITRYEIGGHWDSRETVTRFKLIFTTVGDFHTNGTIVLYKLNTS